MNVNLWQTEERRGGAKIYWKLAEGVTIPADGSIDEEMTLWPGSILTPSTIEFRDARHGLIAALSDLPRHIVQPDFSFRLRGQLNFSEA